MTDENASDPNEGLSTEHPNQSPSDTNWSLPRKSAISWVVGVTIVGILAIAVIENLTGAATPLSKSSVASDFRISLFSGNVASGLPVVNGHMPGTAPCEFDKCSYIISVKNTGGKPLLFVSTDFSAYDSQDREYRPSSYGSYQCNPDQTGWIELDYSVDTNTHLKYLVMRQGDEEARVTLPDPNNPEYLSTETPTPGA